MKTGIFILLFCLWAQGVTGEPGSSVQYLDHRCINVKTSEEVMNDKQVNLAIRNEQYDAHKRISCKDMDGELPAYTAQDDWLEIFSMIDNITEKGFASCQQFPQVYDSVHLSLHNPSVFRNCNVVIDFCAKCPSGCARVYPRTFQSREDTIAWGVGTMKLVEGQCAHIWMEQNILQAKNDKESWILELQTTCSACFRGICSSQQGREVYQDYLYEIASFIDDDEQPQAVMEKICMTPSALGYFSFKNFHLQRRFNTFVPELSIKLRLQNIWYIVYPSLVSWIFCVHILLYCFPHCKANIFNRHLDEELKEKNDPFWNYLIKRIATKPIRMQQKKMRRKMAKKLKRKRSRMKKCHPAPTWKLATGKVIGQKFGPLGRGGRKKA